MVPSHLAALSVPKYRPNINQFDEIQEYFVEGHDVPEYISVYRVERLAEIHIGCQPSAEVTQTLTEDTKCQDAIDGRLVGCETRLLVALVS